MDGFNGQNNTGYSDPGYSQDPYTQPYTQMPGQGMYGQGNVQGYQTGEIKCPGKEIAGLVLGINAIVWGGLGAVFGLMPFYGLIFGFIWGGFGIGFGIATNILHKKVHEQANVITSKIETGKKLATIGIVLSIVGMVISVIAAIIIGLLFGISVFSAASQSGNVTF
ncbi:MAG: hypothetical protein K5879_07900 [Lachnospiraceae bacterium]|nr:hypothetical protein [Lachnospiraceae bacterium]